MQLLGLTELKIKMRIWISNAPVSETVIIKLHGFTNECNGEKFLMCLNHVLKNREYWRST